MKQLILSLDLVDSARAHTLVRTLKPHLAMVKIGHVILSTLRHSEIKDICQDIPILLDLKFFDIPNTLVQSLTHYKQSFPNIVGITFNGNMSNETVIELVALEKKLAIKMLAVLILSSDKVDVENFLQQAQIAYSLGIRHFICPPAYTELLRQSFADEILLYSPGIRASSDADNDHMMSTSHHENSRRGGNFMIVGRPFIESKNLQQTLLEYC